jgi:hypothetical protein
MKLLLDECVTRYLKPEFAGHDVHTVDEAGLKGLKNGHLLRAASGNFDVRITVDQSLSYQQNLSRFGLAILVLTASSNAFDALKPLIPRALRALDRIEPGQVVRVDAEREGDKL